MMTGVKQMQSEKGIVLMSCLAILSALVLTGIGVRVMLQNDYRILTNFRGASEAFYLSVAGLEWAKSEIVRTTSFPPALPNQSKIFSGGEFSVSFASSATDGPLAARVTLNSTGTSRGARHVLQARLTKFYDLADAAMGLRGNGTGVNLSGDNLFFSGADHDPGTGAPVSGAKARSAVSAGGDALRAMVEQSLGSPPRQGVLDDSADVPAISTSDYLPANAVTQLANDLCASSLAFRHPIPGDGSLTIENESWGNQATPQIHCLEGLAASGDAVTIAGNHTGAGILVVKNADLILAETFRWEGLVIVTGNEVSLKTMGSGTKEVLGASIVNETGNPGAGRNILDIQGDVRMLFSRQALNRASLLIPAQTLDNAYESLPSAISQDYWRALTP